MQGRRFRKEFVIRRLTLSRRRLSCVAVAAALLGLVAVVASAWVVAPRPRDLSVRVEARPRLSGERPWPLSAITPNLRDAVIATEDERFYRHHGIDTIGLLRAIPYDIRHLSLRQGASTIPEQLGKLLYLDGYDHSPWLKLQAVVIALRLEARYTREQILWAYLNSVYLGAGAYGVQAASETYFGRPASRLDLAQASLLAGLIQAPTAYNPLVAPRAARSRQVYVLQAMVRNGYVTATEASSALAAPLALRGKTPLPPITGANFAARPNLQVGQLVAGLVLIVGGVLLFFLRRLRPLPVWRLAAATAGLVGVLIVFGSYRGA